MANTAVRSLLLTLSLACLAFSVSADPHSKSSGRSARQADSDLTVHEWGTFTSIADRSGAAVTWHPLDGLYDLPDFVEHFRTLDFKVSLRGTIRMETPVLYFYSPTETTVSAKVGFRNGVITEWYPHASHIEPNPDKVLDESALFHWLQVDGGIAWDSVSVEPGRAAQFPGDDRASRYYAARETSAAPLVVKTSSGTQEEKFLFYRGVSAFPVPVAAQSTADGKALVRNLSPEQIPSLILFERRGDQLGYRLAGPLESETLIDPPELTSSVESLSQDLEGVLIAQGLYPDEARAMVETWRTSWFEEGARLLYIVPRAFVDEILPLSVSPAPSETVRVFVGRMELITPATEQAVEKALAARDRSVIHKYGRFLEPILDHLKAENPSRAGQFDKELEETYNVELVDPPAR
ncbi:MAG: hypothetical protein ACLP72_04185 [Candidatus Sulfotelmatobacter sp.]